MSAQQHHRSDCLDHLADGQLVDQTYEEITKWAEENLAEIGNKLGCELHEGEEFKSVWQQPVQQDVGRGPILGFLDLAVYAKSGGPYRSTRWLFAIKISVRNEHPVRFVRELRLRQAGWISDELAPRSGSSHNTRVSHLPIVVICPDATASKILEEQGFRFIQFAKSKRAR